MANGKRSQSIVANGPGRTVRDWPASERPCERLLRQGRQALSEAGLLAVFLRIGLPGRSVLDLARGAIERFGSLNTLLGASIEEIQAMPGFGPAKCAQLLAVIELSRRALRAQVQRHNLLDSPSKVRDYLRLRIGRLTHEVFAALFLDAQNWLIDDEELFRGTLTQTSVYPREVVKRALARNAAAIIFAHNHPSGLADPSRADESLRTNRSPGRCAIPWRWLTFGCWTTSSSPSPRACRLPNGACSRVGRPPAIDWNSVSGAGILAGFRLAVARLATVGLGG
jgi:DNA repair protein RadC